jgi:photosynthetic reaction center H subunit
MSKGAFTAYFDVAQLVLYMFWIFFAGLIWYLVRENRREGYPMIADRGIIEGWLPVPEPKMYLLPNGEKVYAPRENSGAESPIQAERLEGHGGTAYIPVGDPLEAGIGPGSWTARADHVDLDHEGNPRIRPLALLPAYGVTERDPDPRGMTLYDGKGEAAGMVVELWLDMPEMIFRYLEAEVQGAAGSVRVLVPMTFARVRRDGVHVYALLAHQFAGIPRPRLPDQLTMLEEERIASYCGGGLLYAEPSRAEPLV